MKRILIVDDDSTIRDSLSEALADNATDAGRRANRRVELAIMANDDLKEAAERQTAG